MEQLKRILLVFIILFFFNYNLVSQNKKLSKATHKITNKIIEKEINNFINLYEKEYSKEEKVISLFIHKRDKKTIYTITYSFNFDFLEYGFDNKFNRYPDIISRVKNNYVFIYFVDVVNNFEIKKPLLIELAEECFPIQYKGFLLRNSNVVLFIDYHRIPVVKLVFEKEKLLEKTMYRN